MPCMSCRSNDSYRVGPFVNLDGSWKKIDPVKTVDIQLGEPEINEFGPDRVIGMHVHVDGLETYDQVKDLIGYVHSLWEKK